MANLIREREEDYITLNLFFTRHGYACSNLLTDSTGARKLLTINTRAPNSPLTDFGITRSFNIGKIFKIHNILPTRYALMSSPISRAMQTAYYQYSIHNCDQFQSPKSIYIFPNINETKNISDRLSSVTSLSKTVTSSIPVKEPKLSSVPILEQIPDDFEVIEKTDAEGFRFTNEHNSTSAFYEDLKIIHQSGSKLNLLFNTMVDFPERIPTIFISDTIYHTQHEESELNPSYDKFIKALLLNLNKYKDDAIDYDDTSKQTYNFVLTSHGNYIKHLIEYFGHTKPENILNNEIHFFKLKILKDKFLMKDSDDRQIEPNEILTSDIRKIFTIPIKYKKLINFEHEPKLDIENLRFKNFFESCCTWEPTFSISNCKKALSPSIDGYAYNKAYNQEKNLFHTINKYIEKDLIDDLNHNREKNFFKNSPIFSSVESSKQQKFENFIKFKEQIIKLLEIFIGTGRYFKYKKDKYVDFGLQDILSQHSSYCLIIKEIITKLEDLTTRLKDIELKDDKQVAGSIRLYNIGSIPTVASLSFQYI